MSKAYIRELPAPEQFQPFELVIEVQSAEEAENIRAALYCANGEPLTIARGLLAARLDKQLEAEVVQNCDNCHTSPCRYWYPAPYTACPDWQPCAD